jgi:FKBP-type peptidyl-prolyl cis-trans isomerase 2
MSAEQKLKEGDIVTTVQEVSNKSDLLFFTDRQQVYKARAFDFEDSKASVLGEYLPGKLGMEQGEKKTVTVPPEEGYGPRNPALQQSVPLSNLPEGIQEGDQLRLVHEQQEIPVWVREINPDDEVAMIDANHPLAGVTLVFDLELVGHQAGE